MNFFCVQVVLLLLSVCLVVGGSPVPTASHDAVFVIRDKPDFPVADQMEENKDIKTHVVGKMDDLEATTWISSLSELNFTFPPDMARSLELQEFVDSP